MKRNRGFVLVEILIALAILSIVLLSVISGVTSSVYVIGGMKKYTCAMMIARTRMNDFLLHNMRGTDLKDEPVKEYEGFRVSRVTKRFENAMIDLGPMTANKTDIIVSWKERGREREYKISYIYQTQ
jgi:type II secretion system protein I